MRRRGGRALFVLIVLLAWGSWVATAPADDRLYWANAGDDTIRTGPLAGSAISQPLYDSADGVDAPNGLSVDGGRVYWSSRSQDRILSAPISGSGPVKTLYGPADGVDGAEGVSVDPVARRVYWANAATGVESIRAAPVSGSGPVDIVYNSADGVDAPRGVTVDPSTQRVYLANAGDDSIRRGALSGAGATTPLYTEALGAAPHGVAADGATARIIWGDFNTDLIRGGPIAGGGTVTSLYVGPTVRDPEGVMVDPAPGLVYWADGFNSTIRRAPAAGGGGVDVLYSSAQGVSSPNYLAAVRAPAPSGAPVISGGGQVGQKLTCSDGTWNPGPVASNIHRSPGSFAYQWSRDGTNIAGATAKTHTPTATGQYRCRVTGSNPAGSESQTSAQRLVNRFSFGKVNRNKRKGTAKLTVEFELPASGDIELDRTKKVKGAEKQISGADEAKLAVKPKGKAKKKLNRKGKAKVKAEVTFTPAGGEPKTESESVKLVMR